MTAPTAPSTPSAAPSIGDEPPVPATQPAPAPTPAPAPAPGPAPATGDEPLGDGGLKALQSEREQRKALEKQLAELKPLADKARELEEAQKTEAQKLADRAEQADKRARAAEARAVALAAGLPKEMAERLRGNTAEELEADAAALKELLGAGSGDSTTRPTAPKPDPTQGQRGPVDIDAQIADAVSKGDIRESIRLKNLKALGQQQK